MMPTMQIEPAIDDVLRTMVETIGMERDADTPRQSTPPTWTTFQARIVAQQRDQRYSRATWIQVYNLPETDETRADRIHPNGCLQAIYPFVSSL